MILGFLGKGGSGKSTLATAMTRYLHARGDSVLALDADYNMDLSHNLSVPEDMRYLGDGAKQDMKTHLNVDSSTLFSDIVLHKTEEQYFTLDPVDTFTKTYSVESQTNLRVMSVGPHTEEVLTDKLCSHGLGALLKVYLPLLQLQKNHHVVVDEKAGTDSVGTGVQTGFDFAVIVAEPTIYGIKAAKQIAHVLERTKTPYGFVINKMKHTDTIESIEKELGKKPLACIPFTESVGLSYMETIYTYAESHQNTYGDTRLARSRSKFMYNQSI